jgi:hypothetical protein
VVEVIDIYMKKYDKKINLIKLVFERNHLEFFLKGILLLNGMEHLFEKKDTLNK